MTHLAMRQSRVEDRLFSGGEAGLSLEAAKVGVSANGSPIGVEGGDGNGLRLEEAQPLCQRDTSALGMGVEPQHLQTGQRIRKGVIGTSNVSNVDGKVVRGSKKECREKVHDQGVTISTTPSTEWSSLAAQLAMFDPMAHIINAITKTSQGVCEEFQVGRAGPLRVRDNAVPFQVGRNTSHQAISQQAS